MKQPPDPYREFTPEHVMAFMLDRWLTYIDETDPTITREQYPLEPVLEFLTRGKIAPPWDNETMRLAKVICREHIEQAYPMLQKLHKRCESDLFAPIQKELKLQLNRCVQNPQMRLTLMQQAQEVETIEECLGIATTDEQVYYSFGTVCDRMQINWLKERVKEFGLTPILQLQPLPIERIIWLDEERKKRNRGNVVYGTGYDLPESVKAHDNVPISYYTDKKDVPPEGERDPRRKMIEKFLSRDSSEGWSKN